MTRRHSGSHAIAWAAITISSYIGFLRAYTRRRGIAVPTLRGLIKVLVEAEGKNGGWNMKKLMLPYLLFPLFAIGGCTGNVPKTDSQKVEAQEPLVETYTVERYKLFPTQNMWTFIKLDTQTGQMWQLQYSVNDDKGRFEYDLNPNALVVNDKKVNGRFELYPTKNIYNFILLDKIDGKAWQVQWSFDEENRAVLPINK